MIKLDQRYARQDLIDFLQDAFLQDYVRDVRPVGTQGLNVIKKATSLGRSDSLDLQIFEFEHIGSANKRVALTKEAFQLMRQSATFNALAIFYGHDNDDWRFSFLTANPERTEKGKTTLAYSNPRRYSFFLGPNAKINTPNRFLIKDGQIRNFEDLLSRFNVEIVTKEFFENYKKLFDRLLSYLKKDNSFQAFANRNGVDTASFAKKLLGQIVFLYFLQRKGWLGAKRGDSISSGDKNFLRSLFDKSLKKKCNFYNEYLEKLFYGALNKPPEKAGSYYRNYFNCQIPFLNGGLFEPPQNYNWEGEFLLLPNKLFSKDPNNPNHGDGILDIFDLYNFTVDESDFLDKEVSVDPEMLGKVFENLLEENLRKGKGTYYTPREIVNYMCEESVVNYLVTETGLKSEDIKSKYFPAYNVFGDEKVEVKDVSISEQIIKSLTNIKVVDPACGSGAFLVGMLQQITHLRYDLEGRSKLIGRRDAASSEYEIKKQTIQNCIYGVDIDPGAVEIAKLRLWLSLVVDYDLEDIEPLPNLDYKIMQGNSLIEELVLGDTNIKLYDSESIQKARRSKRMKNLFDQETQITLFDDENDKALKMMKSLQLKYFSTSDSENKKKLKTQIENIEHILIKTSIKSTIDDLHSQKINIRTIPGVGLRPEDVKKLEKISSKESQIFAILDELEKTRTKPFFLWHLHFSDVFEEKAGFDVVIANPPYINAIDMKKSFDPNIRTRFKELYESAKGAYDIYLLFFEKGFQLLRNRGGLTFITPNKYLSASYAVGLRDYVVRNHQLNTIVDVSQIKVFAEVSTYPIISFFIKSSNSPYKIATIKLRNNDLEDLATKELDILINESAYLTLLPDYIWGFLLSDHFNLVKKVFEQSMPMIKAANISASSTASESDDYSQFISENKMSESLKLINTGTIDPYQSLWGTNKLTNKGKKYLNPYLSTNNSIISPQRKALYKMPKIIVAKLGLSLEAYLDCSGEYGSLNTNCIFNPSEGFSLKYLAAFIHSSLFRFIYGQFFGSLRMGGGYYQFQAPQLKAMPVKKADKLVLKKVENVLDRILSALIEQSSIEDYQNQINKELYNLYSLTEKEIKIVEGGINVS